MLEKEMTGLREVLASPAEISDVAATEIRTKLAGQPFGARTGSILRSIERGNDSVASAVLNADKTIVDFITDAERDFILSAWRKKKHPDETARLALLESDSANLEQVGRILQTYQRSLSNPSLAVEVKPLSRRGAPGPVPQNRSASLEQNAKETLAWMNGR